MLQKGYNYQDMDGEHWPDARIGDELYYEIEFSEWLNKENDTTVSVEWDVTEDLTILDEFNSGSSAFVKLATKKFGTFKAVCKLHLSETGQDDIVYEQTKTVHMMLKVV